MINDVEKILLSEEQIAEKVKDYAQRLNDGEKTFIKSMIKVLFVCH